MRDLHTLGKSCSIRLKCYGLFNDGINCKFEHIYTVLIENFEAVAKKRYIVSREEFQALENTFTSHKLYLPTYHPDYTPTGKQQLNKHFVSTHISLVKNLHYFAYNCNLNPLRWGATITACINPQIGEFTKAHAHDWLVYSQSVRFLHNAAPYNADHVSMINTRQNMDFWSVHQDEETLTSYIFMCCGLMRNMAILHVKLKIFLENATRIQRGCRVPR